jgi:hypothetical protein
MRIACTILVLALLLSTQISAQSETSYDVEHECICLIDSIAADTIIQFWRFTQSNNPGEYNVDVTFDFTGAYTPTGEVLSCKDYYLEDNPGGSGTAGTLTIWTGPHSLGNSNVTESGQILSSAFTGALKPPAGTTAQQPAGSPGYLRFNTTNLGLEGYDGGAYRFLPWASTDNFTAAHVPYSDGNQLISSANLQYDGEFRVGGTDQGNYRLQMNGGSAAFDSGSHEVFFAVTTGNTPTLQIDGEFNGAVALEIATGNVLLSSSASRYLQQAFSSTNQFGFMVENDNTGLTASIEETLIYRNKAAADSISRAALYLGIADHGINGTYSGRDLMLEMRTGTLNAGGSVSNHYKNAGAFMQWVHKRGSIGNSQTKAAEEGTFVINPDSANFSVKFTVGTIVNGTFSRGLHVYGSKVGVGSMSTPTSDFDVNGKIRIRNLPDSLYIYELRANSDGRIVRQIGAFVGTINTTTDGSGDVTIAHGMGVTPTHVGIEVTGTTPWTTSMVSADATNFTIRFYLAGVPVASGAVTATWLAKT